MTSRRFKPRRSLGPGCARRAVTVRYRPARRPVCRGWLARHRGGVSEANAAVVVGAVLRDRKLDRLATT
jgi:hypothetical protein